MTGFFDRMLGRGKESSANKAKERLQFVLVHDRINLPPERLKEMKQEILAVISKYVKVSDEEVDIALEQRDRNNNTLIAEIPFSESLKTDLDESDMQDESGAANAMMLDLDDDDAVDEIVKHHDDDDSSAMDDD